MKLINVDDLTDDVILKYLGRPYYSCLPDIRDMLDETPAADAELVRHGHWDLVQNGKGVCSHCNRLDNIDPLATHCRFCGAKMDEGDDLVQTAQMNG